VKKVEHFKAMIKAGQKSPADATAVVNDILDPNSEPSISPDALPVQSQSVLNKGKAMAPNTWFHYEHPEHGKIEVSAHHDGKQAQILGVGALGDTHVHPEQDAGMGPEHMKTMTAQALKLGPGQHMKKEEMKKSEKAEHKISDVKVHSHKNAEYGSGPNYGDVIYTAKINGKAHRFKTESMHNSMISHLHHAEDTGKVHPELHDHISEAHKNGESERVYGMKKSEWTAEEIVVQALKNVQTKLDLQKAEEMKRDRAPEDTGAIYNEEQEVGNQNDIQEAAKRETAQLNGKKLKEYLEKAKNKSEKAAKSPLKDK